MTQTIQKEEERFEIESTKFYESSVELKITNGDEYVASQGTIQDITRFVKVVEKFMNPLIKMAHDSHKALTTAKNKLLGPALEARLKHQTIGQTYRNEQERLVKVEQERLAKIVRIAEEEKRKVEEEKALKLAQEAEDRGDNKLAEEILSTPVEVVPPPPPPSIAPAVPKVAGVGQTRNYKAELIDPKKVDPNMLMQASVRDRLEAAAKKLARVTEGKTEIPGFKITVFYRQTNRSK